MYVPLRISSQFSIGFGAIKPADIVDFCREHTLPAAGITDANTLSGAMTLSKTLAKAGIQPIIGVSLDIDWQGHAAPLIFYPRNAAGYEAVLRLVNTRNLARDPRPLSFEAMRDLVGDAGDQIIVLTGGAQGLAETLLSHKVKIAPMMEALRETFPGTLYVEIQRGADAAAGPFEAVLRKAAEHLDLPLVATACAEYARAEDMQAQDALICIADKTYLGMSHRRRAQPDHHLLDDAQMRARFSDIEYAVDASAEIARRIGLLLESKAPSLPAFAEDGGEDAALAQKAREGLDARLAANAIVAKSEIKTYRDRLEYELGVIARMGYSGYFLIVADFIAWAKSQGIPVGPGRGSGAGSLVAYATTITDIDPIRFGLIFERFLNPDRVSMPDFDIDFCKNRRDDVIEYVRERYGAERVAHIAAFGTLQARAAVRDVARVMEIPYPVADRFASMIPNNPANPVGLGEAMQEPALADALAAAEPEIRDLFDLALRVEGLYRTVSTHAAGVIISDRPVAEVVPVHLDGDGMLSTSFEMKATEEAGLVKFDFLGLKNLDIIEEALGFIKQVEGKSLDFTSIGLGDRKTYQQLARGDGFAVFQLESSGMCEAMRELQVDSIDDLTALIALYRPGPMDQISTYADVKQGREEVHYDHPETREVLEPTNGVMIYQEQVMEIARRLAGYSMGEADLLRRAMGKKIAAEMDAQRMHFIEGAGAGWVNITTETGETRKVHANAKLAALDGSGRQLSLAEAMEEGVEVAL